MSFKDDVQFLREKKSTKQIMGLPLLFFGDDSVTSTDTKKPLINKYLPKTKSLLKKERIFNGLLSVDIHPAFYTEALSFYIPSRKGMYKIKDIIADMLLLKSTMPGQLEDSEEILMTAKSFKDNVLTAPENDANLTEFDRRYISLDDIKEIIARVEAGENFDDILPSYNGGYKRGSNAMVIRQKSSPTKLNGKVNVDAGDGREELNKSKLKTNEEIFSAYNIPLEYLKKPVKAPDGSEWRFVDVAKSFYRSSENEKTPYLTFKWESPFSHGFSKDKEILRDFDIQVIAKWIQQANKPKNEALIRPHHTREKHLTDKKSLLNYLTKVTNEYEGRYEGNPFPHLTCFMSALCPLEYKGTKYTISGQHIEDPNRLFLKPYGANSTGNDNSIDVPVENVIKMAVLQMKKKPENFKLESDGYYHQTSEVSDENYIQWKLDPLKQIRASLNPGKDMKKIAGRADAFASQYAK